MNSYDKAAFATMWGFVAISVACIFTGHHGGGMLFGFFSFMMFIRVFGD